MCKDKIFEIFSRWRYFRHQVWNVYVRHYIFSATRAQNLSNSRKKQFLHVNSDSPKKSTLTRRYFNLKLKIELRHPYRDSYIVCTRRVGRYYHFRKLSKLRENTTSILNYCFSREIYTLAHQTNYVKTSLLLINRMYLILSSMEIQMSFIQPKYATISFTLSEKKPLTNL